MKISKKRKIPSVTRPANQAVQGRYEERLLHALDLNGGGAKIEVYDFNEKMDKEDFGLGNWLGDLF